jgi:hypothetical protein
MAKNFNQTIFNYFVWTPLGSRVNIYINFCLQIPVSLTPVANLPPVSTTLAKLVAKFAAGVVDTGGKFAAGVIDTGSNSAAGPNLKRPLWDTLGLGGK